MTEWISIAGDCAFEKKRKMIKPRDLMLTGRLDGDLQILLKDVMIPHSGVVENINPALTAKEKKRRNKRNQ